MSLSFFFLGRDGRDGVNGKKNKGIFKFQQKFFSVSIQVIKLVSTRTMENKDYAFLLVFVVLVVYEL